MLARKIVMHGGAIGLNLSRDNIAMSFDYFYSVLFLRAPIASNSNTQIIVMGALAMIIFVCIIVYNRKNIKELKTNIFYFIIAFAFLAPNFAGERLWFQGNRMYLSLFALTIILFLFLTPYICNKKIKIRIFTVSAIAIFLIASSIVSFKRMNYFNGALAFWGEMISESKYQNITAHKFHAYALIENQRPQEAVSELLPICQAMQFSYDETNYALGQAFLLSGQFENAAKLYEFMIANKQMPIPQVYASIIISYVYLNDQKKADQWLLEFSKAFNAPPETVVQYVNNFNDYLRNLAQGKA
jgi:hypothetical protein